ncbi:MAG: ribose 5-phosphate isomerase B [Candidatus Hydrogenedentota bacterium]|jgi:ribose 5-phosphate isomerase B|uniref:Ribose 5-phosphate isomerase B n=1 Tax=Sumerlaea chitinivorans TaxID=2250252 RepID=A0A2Z4Y3V2_SUMC1|nr:Ribose 5-phosphate isomerase B [Candidatus Sumerlaea chitinivorans]RMH27605.1 MAG: ribose 5-phosphate isomerase B [Candidatus Hydrogenedentota bacterium]GIX44576.1 MAG: putative sugar phosphate isomerase YwlF [Candidatus Sumerlaea sp.]
MRIAFSNDHAGAPMREHLLPILKQLGHEVLDFGADGQASVDYPDYASPALRALISGQVERTILVCGSGVGMSIVANRIPGVRCALAVDVWTAEMSRRHNDTNCLALRAREQDPKVNVAIVEKWLATDFEGDRHRRRIEKIEEIAAALRKEL